MRKTWAFIKMRFVQFSHDVSSMVFSFVFPVAMILIFGFIFSRGSDTVITVHYHGEDTALPGRLAESEIIRLVPAAYGAEAAREKLKEREISFYLDTSPATGEGRPVLYYNQADSDYRILLAALKQELSGLEEVGVEEVVVLQKLKPYIYVIFPGIFGMVLLMIGTIGIGSVIITEREKGVLKKLKTIDANPLPYLSSFILSRLVVSMVVLYELLLLVRVAFGLQIQGSLLLLNLVVLLGSLSFLGLAVMVSSLARDRNQFNLFLNLVQLPMIIIGGVFFSIEFFPALLQKIVIFSPLTAFTVSFQKVIYDGLPLQEIGQIIQELLILGGWALVTTFIGVKKIRW